MLDIGGSPGSNQPVVLNAITDAGNNAEAGGMTNSVTVSATNEMAAAVASTEPSTATSTNAAAAATPPIHFEDVPITTAIETLARLANINYLLDPRIGYGQAENGQVKNEPVLSVRWDNVTPAQALVALLDNYGLQMIDNPRTKIAKITTKDPTAPPNLITRVVQLKYSSTTNMTTAVATALTDKRSRVIPDSRTTQLIVVATEQEQSAVDTLVAQLDRPTRQVLIETKILEISSNPRTKKGIDWSGTLDAQSFQIGNDALPGIAPTPPVTVIDPVTGLPVTSPGTPGTIGGILSDPKLLGSLNQGAFFSPSAFFLNADGVSAILSFLNSESDAQIISTPRVVTLDNETATIEVTRAFPVFNTTAGTQGSPGGSQVTYSNLGTILSVTPRISANDYVWLKVTPTVSSFFGTVTKTVGGLVNQADEFDNRRIDTQVLVPNSHTLVMGGLVKDNPNAQYVKVPILGDIPVLGLAFRHEDKSLEKDNLLLFITPTIVKESDFKPTTSTFLDSEPRQMKDPMNPRSILDSGVPRGDWSNPLTPNVK